MDLPGFSSRETWHMLGSLSKSSVDKVESAGMPHGSSGFEQAAKRLQARQAPEHRTRMRNVPRTCFSSRRHNATAEAGAEANAKAHAETKAIAKAHAEAEANAEANAT